MLSSRIYKLQHAILLRTLSQAGGIKSSTWSEISSRQRWTRPSHIQLRPRPQVAGYFGKRRLLSPNTATVHTYPAFSGTENGGFQIRSPGWRVLKTEIHCIRVDGRKQGLSNTMTPCLSSKLVLPRIWFENATCGRRFFEIRRKKPLRFRKYPATLNATCGRRLFRNTEEKSPFSKIPGYVWTRPEHPTFGLNILSLLQRTATQLGPGLSKDANRDMCLLPPSTRQIVFL